MFVGFLSGSLLLSKGVLELIVEASKMMQQKSGTISRIRSFGAECPTSGLEVSWVLVPPGDWRGGRGNGGDAAENWSRLALKRSGEYTDKPN